MFEQLEESVNHQDDDATLPFVGFHALAGQISIRSSGAVRPPCSEALRGFPCNFDALSSESFLNADNIAAFGELFDQASFTAELFLPSHHSDWAFNVTILMSPAKGMPEVSRWLMIL